MKRRLSYDPVTGMEVVYHDDGEKVAIEHRQDISKFLEFNKAAQNEHVNYTQKGIEHYHVAHIPALAVVKIRDELGLDVFNPDHREDVFKKIINNPDYAYLRTTPGTV